MPMLLRPVASSWVSQVPLLACPCCKHRAPPVTGLSSFEIDSACEIDFPVEDNNRMQAARVPSSGTNP